MIHVMGYVIVIGLSLLFAWSLAELGRVYYLLVRDEIRARRSLPPQPRSKRR